MVIVINHYYNQMLKKVSKLIAYCIVTQSKIINPYTHEPLPPHPYITEAQLFNRVTECSRDFRKWRKVKVEERREIVKKFIVNIINDKQFLKPLISDFTGKSFKNIQQQFRQTEIVTTKLIEDSKIALKEQNKKTVFLKQSFTTRIIQDPVGLAMIFPYYSQPIFDSLIHLIPCLISGNGALVKVSDFNHFLGEYLNKKCNEILGYKNLINDAFIHPSQLAIVRQFRPIKKLIFAGSPTSARRIFQVMAQKRFIDCNLFYGGHEAAFVDESADLGLAANQICKNAFYNNGQSYECIRRLYIHKNVSSKLTELIANKIQEIKLGNPKHDDTDLGPITVQQSVLNYEQMVNDAIDMGAKCITGGIIHTDGVTKGFFCEPTLLANCDTNMQVIQQQFNGPLLCITDVDGYEDFKSEVQDNKYGTGLRIFTKNPFKYSHLVDSLEVGIVAFNSGSIIDGDLPIEGWKGSGKGKILSELSYHQYLVSKSFIIDEEL